MSAGGGRKSTPSRDTMAGLSCGRSDSDSGICKGGNESPEDRRRRLNTERIRRYRAKPKGRAAYTRYNQSAKHLAARARYVRTLKGKATNFRYSHSEAGQIMRHLHAQTVQAKLSRRLRQQERTY